MNTAQYRTAAYDAEKALQWAQAADLWQKAHDAYPPHHPGSQLAAHDKAQLLRSAERCRAMASSK